MSGNRQDALKRWANFSSDQREVLRKNSTKVLEENRKKANAAKRVKALLNPAAYKHVLYGTWGGLVERCCDSSCKDFPAYGGKGIIVFEAWKDDFFEFVTYIESNLGPRPEGKTSAGRPLHTLDRINPYGNYEPGNLRWATYKQQNSNQRLPDGSIGTARAFYQKQPENREKKSEEMFLAWQEGRYQ